MFKPEDKDLNLMYEIKDYLYKNRIKYRWTEDMFQIGDDDRNRENTKFTPAYRILIMNKNGAPVCDFALNFLSNGVEFWDRIYREDAYTVGDLNNAIKVLKRAVAEHSDVKLPKGKTISKTVLLDMGIDPDSEGGTANA